MSCKTLFAPGSGSKTAAWWNEIHICLYPVKSCEVGDRMADGLLFDSDGEEHHLSDCLGKYILSDFWSRECGLCLMAQPELEELAEKFRGRLHLTSISLEVSEKGWKEAIRDLKGTFETRLRKLCKIYEDENK